MIYIGIDIDKKKCVACLQDETGHILNEIKFENKKSGFQTLLNIVKGREARAVIESTGNLWIRLYTVLEEKGIKVKLANPYKTRVIAESVIKTDKIDAKTLADLLRADLIAASHVPPAHVRAVRDLLRHRINMVNDRTRVKNRIHSLLDKYELPEFEGTDLFSKAGMKWFTEQMPHLSLEDQFVMQSLLYELNALDTLIKEVDKEIALHADVTEGVKLLMSIIGISFHTALLFICEVDDILRFPSSSTLVSWIGLAPRVHQSGETCYHGRITKRGSPRLRGALIQAAHAAVKHDPHWRSKFNRISRSKGKQKAYVAIARELAVTMYNMLRNEEKYRFGREKTYTQKLKNLDRLTRKAQTNQGEVLSECFSL
jgi:transposase